MDATPPYAAGDRETSPGAGEFGPGPAAADAGSVNGGADPGRDGNSASPDAGDAGREDHSATTSDDVDGNAVDPVAPGQAMPWRRRAGYHTARLRARFLAWRRRLNATRAGRLGVKLTVAVVGTLVIAIGVVLLPLPGPGWLIVFSGLAILALEFHWARRLLTFGRAQLRRWTALVREGSWVVRLSTSVALLAVVLAALWLSAKLAFGAAIP